MLTLLSVAWLQIREWAERDDPRLPAQLGELVPNYHNVWWARNLLYRNPETRGGDLRSARHLRNWYRYVRRIFLVWSGRAVTSLARPEVCIVGKPDSVCTIGFDKVGDVCANDGEPDEAFCQYENSNFVCKKRSCSEGASVNFDVVNWFGHDVFKLQAQGNLTWAVLCRLDSDGDGLTNGEELGDPCCWHDHTQPSEGSQQPVMPYRNWKLSHPGGDDDPVWPRSFRAAVHWYRGGAPRNCSSIPQNFQGDDSYLRQFQDFYWALDEDNAEKLVPLLVIAKVIGATLVGLLFCYWVTTSKLLVEICGLRGALVGYRTRMAMLFWAYVYSDVVSGVVHILLDHVPHDVPGLGVMARGFQYHHHRPRSITTISWLAYTSHIHPVGILLAPFLWWIQPSRPAQLFWFFSWCFAHLFQTAHRWAHFPVQELPHVALILQRLKIVISSEYHMQHHQSLLDQFSTLGGFADPFLDYVSSHVIPARWYIAWSGVAVGLLLLPLGLDALIQSLLLNMAARCKSLAAIRTSKCPVPKNSGFSAAQTMRFAEHMVLVAWRRKQ